MDASDVVDDGAELGGGWGDHHEDHDDEEAAAPTPAHQDIAAAGAGAPPAAPAPPAIMFKPILRGTISPLVGGGPRKYTWVGNWAMSGEDPLTSGFRYSFDLPIQYMGPPLAPGASPTNPLLPSSVSHQVRVSSCRACPGCRLQAAWPLLLQPLEIPVGGYFLSKDKGPDAEPTKYTEASLKLRVGGPGE